MKDGGSAFPVHVPEQVTPMTIGSGVVQASMCVPAYTSQGMTLRDYFSAKVMQSLIVALADESGIKEEFAEPIAKGSYFMADAMLKARQE